MKTLLIVVVVVALATPFVQAQDEHPLDRMMTRHVISCADIFYNSTTLVPQYYLRNELDSLRMVLKYWDERCGPNEWVARTRILLAIRDSTFRESLYDRSIFNFLVAYHWRLRSLNEESLYYNRELVEKEKDYLEFTTMLAQKAARKSDITPEASFFARYYSGADTTLSSLDRDPGVRSSALYQYYRDYLDETLGLNEYNLSFHAGAWVPLGKNSVLGVHPELGFQLGMKYQRWLADFSLAFRFLKAKQEYLVEYQGAIVPTKEFFGGFIGFEGGREFLRTNRHEADLLFGFGYDGFDVVDKGMNSPDNKSIDAFNLHAGLGYRFYLQEYESDYLGCQVRYNVVHYGTGGGTDLSGNVVTVRFVYGWAGSPEKNRRLEALGYRY